MVDIAKGKKVDLKKYAPVDSLKLEKEIEKIEKERVKETDLEKIKNSGLKVNDWKFIFNKNIENNR